MTFEEKLAAQGRKMAYARALEAEYTLMEASCEIYEHNERFGKEE